MSKEFEDEMIDLILKQLKSLLKKDSILTINIDSCGSFWYEYKKGRYEDLHAIYKGCNTDNLKELKELIERMEKNE